MSCPKSFANKQNSARRERVVDYQHFANPLGKAGTQLLQSARLRPESGRLFYSSNAMLQKQLRTRTYLSPFETCDDSF